LCLKCFEKLDELMKIRNDLIYCQTELYRIEREDIEDVLRSFNDPKLSGNPVVNVVRCDVPEEPLFEIAYVTVKGELRDEDQEATATRQATDFLKIEHSLDDSKDEQNTPVQDTSKLQQENSVQCSRCDFVAPSKRFLQKHCREFHKRIKDEKFAEMAKNKTGM
jgi:hypothetical protein